MSSLLTTGFLLLKRLSISAQRSLQGPNNSFERSLGRKPRNAPEPRDTATVARVVQVSMEQLLATRCSITREAERAIVESKAMLCLRRRPANYCLEDPLGRYVSAGRLRQRFQTSFFWLRQLCRLVLIWEGLSLLLCSGFFFSFFMSPHHHTYLRYSNCTSFQFFDRIS